MVAPTTAMTSQADIAIIGAGPYGLSIAAQLTTAGSNVSVFGVPMQTWTEHMPPGMQLTSDPACSSLADLHGELTLEAFCRDHQLPYEDHYLPVRRNDFIRYGLEFQRRFVPQAEARKLVNLERMGTSHRLQFDRGEDVIAARVVLATGYLPFRYIPPALRELPTALVSHSSDYGPLEQLRARHVAIVGAGSSALDLARLLSQQGCRVTLIARTPRLQKLVSTANAPSRGNGERWLTRLCADAPQFIHQLPDALRIAILESTQNPPASGLPTMPIDDTVTIKLSRPVVHAQERGAGLQLTILATDGSRELIECDHLIAATGYRVDLRKLDFLSEELLSGLRMLDHSPVLSANFESSAAGLYFVGLPAARTFGPALRFIQGAAHAARRILEQLSPSPRRGYTTLGRAAEHSRRTAA